MVVAAIKYFTWALVIPIIILYALDFYWNLISAPPDNSKWIIGIPALVAGFSLYLTLFGIVSLVKRRYPVFAVFLHFLCGLVFLGFLMAATLWTQKKEALGTGELVFASICVLCLIFYSLSKLDYLKKTLLGRSHNMVTAMLRFTGTPSILIYSFLLLSMIIPVIAVSIILIFDLSVNATWKAIFSISGFLWAWFFIRTLLQSSLLRLDTYASLFRPINFWIKQWKMLFLPALGLFLMWYFDWFPMRTWVIWVYSIYGFFWLIRTLGLLFAKKQ